jgi:6-phosphofructokinase 1
MRIGVLTGGGDCPGLNAVIRAVVQRAVKTYAWTVLGVRHGWRGLLREEIEALDLRTVSGILPRGGTILGTSRTNPYKEPTRGSPQAVSSGDRSTPDRSRPQR